jgi:prepilin-type processing-associated H-X9-DG protein
VVIAIVAILMGLLLAGVQRVRATADRSVCLNNLHQVGLALQMYYDSKGSLPPGCSSDSAANPYPYISWCSYILPYVEQPALWHQVTDAYASDRSFLGNAHAVYRAHVLKVFACPADARSFQPGQPGPNGSFVVGFTYYLGVEGTDYLAKDGVLYLDSRTRMQEITDGSSNTLMVGERPPSTDQQFGWWYAGTGQADSGSCDMVLGVRELNVWWNARQCWRGPYFFSAGTIGNPCDMFHYWSLHPNGANFLFADASVRFLPYSADAITPALATRSGNEVVDLP